MGHACPISDVSNPLWVAQHTENIRDWNYPDKAQDLLSQFLADLENQDQQNIAINPDPEQGQTVLHFFNVSYDAAEEDFRMRTV